MKTVDLWSAWFSILMSLAWTVSGFLLLFSVVAPKGTPRWGDLALALLCFVLSDTENLKTKLSLAHK